MRTRLYTPIPQQMVRVVMAHVAQLEDTMLTLMRAMVVLALLTFPALSEWDGVKGPNSAWYEAQQINPEAQMRLGVSWKSCCAHSDVVTTRFRVDRTSAEDVWFYLDDNTWRKVPSDTVQTGKPTPSGEAVMFAYQGVITCFFPSDGGI